MNNRLLLLIFFIIFFFAISVDSTPLSDSEKDTLSIPNKENQLNKKVPGKAMLRSSIIPGWGQYYNENKLKAFVILGGELTFITLTALEDHWAYENLDKSNQAESASLEQYYHDQYEYHKDRKNLFIWWTVLTYLYNIADAYVDAHLYNFDKKLEGEPDFDIKTKTYNKTSYICIEY